MLLAAEPLLAQVTLRQVITFRQTDATTVQPVRYAVEVSTDHFFVGGTAPATARFAGPGTTIELPVQGPSGGYRATRTYASEAAMRRDFPSGTYVLSVGTSLSSYAVDLTRSVTPPRLINWPALQQWDGGPAEIRWTPLAELLPEAGFGLSFGNSAGEAIYYPFGQNTALASIGRSGDLPVARRATFNVTSALDNGLSIYGVSGAINLIAGEWTGRLAVVAHGSRASHPGVFAVVPATGSGAANGNTLAHVLETVVEFAVIRLPSPPKIMTRPSDQALPLGVSATFFVSATGGDLSFQWYRNGSMIAGASAMSLMIPSIQASDAGDYHAVVSNAFGSTATPPAKLTISGSAPPPADSGGYTIVNTSGPPVITRQPTSITVLAGETFRFAVGVSGQSPFTFEWHRNGAPAVGGFNSTYSVLPAVPPVAGRYTVTVRNALGSVTSDEVELVVLPPPRITNLSVRAPLGAGAETLTIGFTIGRRITDPNLRGGESVSMVLRGVGPTLASFGVTNALPDPQFTVYSGETAVAENDNWPGTSNFAALMARVGAFPLTSGSKDAAMFRTLGQGSHSVRISESGGTSGVVLGEIYDTADDEHFSTFSPRLTNVSTLSRTGAGEDALSVGFVIAGTGSRTVLVRGVGPGLAAVGLTSGFVSDPRLTLFSAAGVAVHGNDDWGGTLALRAGFASVGAFSLPIDSRDAALVAVLTPGGYTVEVGSGENIPGLALIEVYELP